MSIYVYGILECKMRVVQRKDERREKEYEV